MIASELEVGDVVMISDSVYKIKRRVNSIDNINRSTIQIYDEKDRLIDALLADLKLPSYITIIKLRDE